MTDLLVGAPMFMVRGSEGRLEEMGRVYVYLQRDPLNLEIQLPPLTGTQAFGRFGSTIAPLGDLNQDGFNGKNWNRSSLTCGRTQLHSIMMHLLIGLYCMNVFYSFNHMVQNAGRHDLIVCLKFNIAAVEVILKVFGDLLSTDSVYISTSSFKDIFTFKR